MNNFGVLCEFVRKNLLIICISLTQHLQVKVTMLLF